MNYDRLIIVATVHHTGTHFIEEDILSDFDARSLNYCGKIAGPSGKNIKIRIHLEPANTENLTEWCSQCEVVVPMRHPISVAESWKARPKKMTQMTQEDLIIQWNILKSVVDPHHPIYLPLDVPDRDNWLQALNAKTGLNIHTHWPVIMSCNKSAELNDDERESVFEVMADGFFDRFGYEV